MLLFAWGIALAGTKPTAARYARMVATPCKWPRPAGRDTAMHHDSSSRTHNCKQGVAARREQLA